MTTTLIASAPGLMLVEANAVLFENRFGFPWGTKVTVVAPPVAQLAAPDAAVTLAQGFTFHAIGGSVKDPTWQSYPSFFLDTEGGDLLRDYEGIARDHALPVIFGNPVPRQIQLPQETQQGIAGAAAA